MEVRINMEVFTNFYDFFGLDLLADSATFVDLINNIFQIGLGLFITCFFIKSLFSLMLNIFNYRLM